MTYLPYITTVVGFTVIGVVAFKVFTASRNSKKNTQSTARKSRERRR